MPFQKPRAQPDFAGLRKWLANSGLFVSNNALYQCIDILIQWLEQLQSIQNEDLADLESDLSGLVALIQQLIQATYLTSTDESVLLPNSRNLIAGENIEFDDSVPNERTIRATASGSYIPLAVGEEPLAFVSDGAGQPILVDYQP